METKELEKTLDGLKEDWEKSKKKQDERLEKLEKGEGVAEIKQELERIDNAIDEKLQILDEQKKRLDQMEAAFKRRPVEVKDHKGDPMSEEEVKERDAVHAYLRKGDTKYWDQLDQKDLQVRVDPDGGYFVHADMSGKLVKRIFETSPIRQFAAVQAIGTDALEGVVDDDEAGAEWVGETADPTDDTTPQVRVWRIPVHEMATKPKATNKILEDANINIEQWLLDHVLQKFLRTENTAFVTGDGAGKPRGFLTYAASADPDVYEYGTIGQFETAVAATLDADALIDLTTGLKEGYAANAVLAANRIAWREARKLKDGDDQYLWQPSLQIGQPATFNGVPVTNFNDMPVIAAGSLSFAIADWAEAYQIVDRIGLSVLRDPYSNKPYVEFYTRRRVGGDVINFDAIKILKIKS